MSLFPHIPEGDEPALIAACLVDPTRLDAVAGMLTGRDFVEWGRAFDMLVQLRESGRDIQDPQVLFAASKSHGLDERLHRAAGWAAIMEAGLPHNAHQYALDIRKASLVRRQRELMAEASMRLQHPKADPAEFATWLSARLDTMAVDMGHGSQHIADVVEQVIAEARNASNRSERGIMTGFYSLDNALGLIRAGELCVVAGRPGDGKTAFACQVATHNAQKQRPVWFATLEMQPRELASRILCGRAGVPSLELRRRAAHHHELEALVEASQQVGPTPLWLWKRPYCTWPQLRAEARIVAAQHKTELIVVDYLAKLERTDGRTLMHEHIGECVRRLKSLASELKCVVLLLVQSARIADNERPKLSHLAQSADIEREADQVIFCHCDQPKNERGTTYLVEVIVEKNRHGGTPSFKFEFDGSRTEFNDPNTPQPDPWLAAYNNGG